MPESQVIANEKNGLTSRGGRPLVGFNISYVPASVLTEFAEKIVRPYYKGNLNAAIQDLTGIIIGPFVGKRTLILTRWNPA